MENENQIKVIVKKPGEKAEVTMIDNSLKSYQDIVNGHIETLHFPKVKNACILINEEGKLEKLKPNIYIPQYEDVLVGNLVVVGIDDDDFTGLKDEQIEKLMYYLEFFSEIHFGYSFEFSPSNKDEQSM